MKDKYYELEQEDLNKVLPRVQIMNHKSLVLSDLKLVLDAIFKDIFDKAQVDLKENNIKWDDDFKGFTIKPKEKKEWIKWQKKR